jgi:GNAT superfamily N-acetyltransferase
MIHEPFDDTGHLLLAVEDGVAVGTVRMNCRKDGPLECERLYDLASLGSYYPNAVSMTTKLMVRRSHRGSGVLQRLVAEAYSVGARNGISVDVIDTNPQLVRLYQQLGYRYYRPNIEHPDYGHVIPLLMFGRDLPYLESIGSPFAALARRLPVDPEAASAFDRLFPNYAAIRPTHVVSAPMLWARFAEYSGFEDAQRAGFLTGFTQDELTELLHCVEAFDCLPGAVVIRQGDEGSGMFGLLSGQAEVRVGSASNARVVDLLHPGDAFGEMAFIAKSRRNASIVVREPSTVMFLSRTEFAKLSEKQPAIALRLMTNLFTLVVERFNARVGHASE